uniref:uncharacterized protein LOC122587692 n=1 Tax=Erigeron canadensis TaxID=72917 RepID=UPI001CB8A919|nr:uncharacterized protein LOC122587692 [Erigeron canadensis]
MSSSDEDSTSYIRNYIIDPEILNTFVTFLEDEEREAKSSAHVNIPRAPRMYIARNHAKAATHLFNHYFVPEPFYPRDYFRTHFRMPKEMFIRIVRDIQTFNAIQPLPAHFQYFHNPPFDVVDAPAINNFQKCTSVVRQLAYSANADQLNEYLEMGQQMSYDALNNFCKCIVQLYHADHGENAPPHGKANTLVATKDTPRLSLKRLLHMICGWHAYFRSVGSNNEINVLNESDLFDQLLEDRAPVVNFTANE